jgi:hypothetical protein
MRLIGSKGDMTEIKLSVKTYLTEGNLRTSIWYMLDNVDIEIHGVVTSNELIDNIYNEIKRE